MKTTRNGLKAIISPSFFSLLFFTLPVCAHDGNHSDYQVSNKWANLANGSEVIGKAHGEIDVAEDGKFYVSTMGKKDIEVGTVRIYSAQGQYLGNLPNAPDDFHGFVIHQDNDGVEYIYGAALKQQRLIKMTLAGDVVLNIDAKAAVPTQYHSSGVRPNNQPRPELSLTAIAVDNQGYMYVVDGYGKDFIHKFDAKGNYLATFAGREAPYNFHNCHKIHIDPRFQPNRLMCTDRKVGRLVHVSLDGAYIGVYAENLRRPSSVDFRGDIAAVAEISGRVSLIDKTGKTVKTLGTNDITTEVNTNMTGPDKWREGVFTAPHGITFDKDGNLYISEWNHWGRIVRYDLQ